jgi:hypothetical protein
MEYRGLDLDAESVKYGVKITKDHIIKQLPVLRMARYKWMQSHQDHP